MSCVWSEIHLRGIRENESDSKSFPSQFLSISLPFIPFDMIIIILALLSFCVLLLPLSIPHAITFILMSTLFSHPSCHGSIHSLPSCYPYQFPLKKKTLFRCLLWMNLSPLIWFILVIPIHPFFSTWYSCTLFSTDVFISLTGRVWFWFVHDNEGM